MKIVTLKRQLDNMRMIKTESVSQNFDKLMKVVNEIIILGEILPEERLVEKVLVSVEEKFELSMADLISALEAQEQRRKMRGENGLEVAIRMKAQVLEKVDWSAMDVDALRSKEEKVSMLPTVEVIDKVYGSCQA
ncbi:hypothetical protein Pint_32985 [Pistacia integerrima]|uniref:Uncharacterized protein n=1 Tax=Pistacia integerrima TaxID=434235 RepID=A0ACC0X590_9ROSI|nr:hypothetical protein Pint_32985 [Pistacia integerrima]